MSPPTVPPDDKVRRQHAYLVGDGGGPVLIGGEGKMLSRAEAVQHLRSMRNVGRLGATEVTLIDYAVDESGAEVVRDLGKVSTLYAGTGTRELSSWLRRASGYGGGDDDDGPPEAA